MKQILIFIIGNFYRLTYCNAANIYRFFYSLKNQGLRGYFAKRKEFRDIFNPFSCKYQYQGSELLYKLTGVKFFKKWPTYCRTLSDFVDNDFNGNCIDFAHAVKRSLKDEGAKNIKLKIYMPDTHGTKAHYLVEYKYEGKQYTAHCASWTVYGEVERGTAREIMQKRYPSSTIYSIW